MARLKNLAIIAYGSQQELEIVGRKLNRENRPKFLAWTEIYPGFWANIQFVDGSELHI